MPMASYKGRLKKLAIIEHDRKYFSADFSGMLVAVIGVVKRGLGVIPSGV